MVPNEDILRHTAKGAARIILEKQVPALQQWAKDFASRTGLTKVRRCTINRVIAAIQALPAAVEAEAYEYAKTHPEIFSQT